MFTTVKRSQFRLTVFDMYYIWAGGSCDNSTTSFEEACEWANEFALDDYSDVYVQRGDDIIYRAAE